MDGDILDFAFIPYALGCAVVHLCADTVLGGDKTREPSQVESNVNRIVSAVHAIVMFYLSITYWQQIPASFWLMDNAVLDAEVTVHQSLTIHCMIGYLLYDTVIELRVGKGWQIFAHHIVGFISHALTLYNNCGPAATYSMMVYLAELSTPFLNLSFLLKEYNLTANPVYTLSGALLLVTFFVVRILLTPYMLYHFVTHWHPTPAHQHLYLLNIGAILFFFGINYLWFYQIVRIVFKKKSSKKSKKGGADKKSDENITSDGDKID